MTNPNDMLDPNVTDGGLARMIQSFNQTGLATGDVDADMFLRNNPTAVFMGILFDQRIRAEVAFSGPYKLRERLGHFDMDKIAVMDPDTFLTLFSASPAVHRFANVMSARTQQFARILCEDYRGDATNIWADGPDFETIKHRVVRFPGFGPGKLKKLLPAMALFGHQLLSQIDSR